jgi:hypothetical protein
MIRFCADDDDAHTHKKGKGIHQFVHQYYHHHQCAGLHIVTSTESQNRTKIMASMETIVPILLLLLCLNLVQLGGASTQDDHENIDQRKDQQFRALQQNSAQNLRGLSANLRNNSAVKGEGNTIIKAGNGGDDSNQHRSGPKDGPQKEACGLAGQPCCVPGVSGHRSFCSDADGNRTHCDFDSNPFDGGVGQCVPCGGEDEPCCRSLTNPCGQGYNCDPTLVDVVTDLTLGVCRPCGAEGQPCCTPLVSDNIFACGRGSICQLDFQVDLDGDFGACVACGGSGQPCCNILKSGGLEDILDDILDAVDNVGEILETIASGGGLDDLLEHLNPNLGIDDLVSLLDFLATLDLEIPCGGSLFPVVPFPIPFGDRLQCILDDPLNTTCQCGGEGQVCCGNSLIDPGTCIGKQACREFKPLPVFQCEPCGEIDMLCCDGPTPCDGPGPDVVCAHPVGSMFGERICQLCGQPGQRCCSSTPGPECATGNCSFITNTCPQP